MTRMSQKPWRIEPVRLVSVATRRGPRKLLLLSVIE